MKQAAFKKMYDEFRSSTSRSFSEDDWDKALNSWGEYRDLIKNNLPIDRWLKNEKNEKNEKNGYLPDFLDTKEQKFGHARIGNYEQVMIYRYTGSDKTRNGKYRNAYANKDAHKVFDTVKDIENDYNNHIQKLLKKLVEARSDQDVYSIETDEDYKQFSCKQILRKITVLMSLEDSSPYKNKYMWIYNDGALENLAKILEIDIDSEKTFLKNNADIYDIAKKYAGLSASSSKSDYIKLYDFLWSLIGDSFNTTELSDFNNSNIIFYGAPGTGKTYGVTKGIEKLKGIDSKLFKDVKIIQFHPSYTYQDFIEGIKPLGISGGSLNLQVVNGSFKDFCIKVKQENEKYYSSLSDSDKPKPDNPNDFAGWPHYYFVVDEINRGNLSNIFGETFALLEYRDYDFSGTYTEKKPCLVSTALSSVISRITNNDDLVYKKVGDEICFGIPFNIHFIGTMNDVDKSIDTFDLALRRRFKWVPKYCDYSVIHDVLIDNSYPEDNVSEYIESCQYLNDFICSSSGGLKLGKSYEIGHAFFLKIRYIPGQNRVTKAKKQEVFDNYIEGTLKEYIRQVADEVEIDNWINKARAAFGLS